MECDRREDGGSRKRAQEKAPVVMAICSIIMISFGFILSHTNKFSISTSCFVVIMICENIEIEQIDLIPDMFVIFVAFIKLVSFESYLTFLTLFTFVQDICNFFDIQYETRGFLSSVRLSFVTLRRPPLDYETVWTGELWSKNNFLN